MLKLDSLSPVEGSRIDAKVRKGRGQGTGNGKTAGKGHGGQKARAGGVKGPYFEGGQMPLVRRIPKRGFANIFATVYKTVNLAQLQHAFGDLEDGATITTDMLEEAGLVKSVLSYRRRMTSDVEGEKVYTEKGVKIKILGNGEFTRKFNVVAHKFTNSAKEKIESLGGKAEVL